LGLQTAAAAKLTSAVVAKEATATVAGAVKATAASVVSAEAAVCRRGCKPGSTLQLAALQDAYTINTVIIVESCRVTVVPMEFLAFVLFIPNLKERTEQLFQRYVPYVLLILLNLGELCDSQTIGTLYYEAKTSVTEREHPDGSWIIIFLSDFLPKAERSVGN
jgi:hypothetical protein